MRIHAFLDYVKHQMFDCVPNSLKKRVFINVDRPDDKYSDQIWIANSHNVDKSLSVVWSSTISKYNQGPHYDMTLIETVFLQFNTVMQLPAVNY